MTVATTVSAWSVPASRIASARMARIWSPSTTLPSWSTARRRLASPSSDEADVGAPLDDGPLEHVEVRGGATLVDVEPVGLGADRDHLGTGVPQGAGPGVGRGAVGAVEDDLIHRGRGGVSVRCLA